MLLTDNWPEIALRLCCALAFGLILGIERQWHGHAAGGRTHAIIALSSATLTVSALMLADKINAGGGTSDPLRVIQGLAQVMGLIAGGLIFVRSDTVRNMTTAASLWMASAGGIAAGAGQWRLLVTAAALTLTLLGLDRILDRMPDASATQDDKAP